MSQNGKLMPNLDQNSTKLLNLTVLQRTDPFVEEILITAAHVTLYGFNIDTSQWSRKDVEGSLFVVKRNTQPRFQFIVMNRRNTDNLVENLLEDFEFEIQLPYLLYRNAAQEVNGIWFYNAHECEEVATLFTRILNAYSKVPTKSKGAPIQSEFEELEAVPSVTVIDGPFEPSSTVNVSDVPDDPSFLNFFSSAMTINNDTNTTIGGGQPNLSSGAFPEPCQQGLVSALQSPSAPLSTPTALMPPIKNSEPKNVTTNRLNNNLVKPSTFFNPPPSCPFMMIPPVSTPMPTAPPLHTPGNIQRPYGAPLLQPFPPPTPPPSLTPAATALHHNEPVVTREKIREALLALVQDNQFVDMVYRAVLNAHSS